MTIKTEDVRRVLAALQGTGVEVQLYVEGQFSPISGPVEDISYSVRHGSTVVIGDERGRAIVQFDEIRHLAVYKTQVA